MSFKLEKYVCDCFSIFLFFPDSKFDLEKIFHRCQKVHEFMHVEQNSKPEWIVVHNFYGKKITHLVIIVC